jgi:hypothetical protein
MIVLDTCCLIGMHSCIENRAVDFASRCGCNVFPDAHNLVVEGSHSLTPCRGTLRTRGEVDILLVLLNLLSFVRDTSDDCVALESLIRCREERHAIFFLKTLHRSVDLIGVEDTSTLELRILAGLPGTETARSDFTAFKPIALTNRCGGSLSLVQIVQEFDTDEFGIQTALEVVEMLLRDDSVKLVFAISSHNNRPAAVINLAVGGDEVVELVPSHRKRRSKCRTREQRQEAGPEAWIPSP